MLQAADDGTVMPDVPPFGELTPADEARRSGSGPLTTEDVRAARAFLSAWDGDLVGLLQPSHEPDARRDPPASR